jgi:hypothetical protein
MFARRFLKLFLACSWLFPGKLGQAAEHAPSPQPKTSVDLPPWTGPRQDFREQEDHILGDWWQGGGLGVVYYTGLNATHQGVFETLGRKLATDLDRPYMEIHKEHLQPSAEDANGLLVYPDGTARVRLFIMPGGHSTYTMQEIAAVKNIVTERAKFAEARRFPQAAFRTGMNYVGVCGGFYTGASGYTVPNSVFCGWGFWPGRCTGIGPGQNRPFPDVVFEAKDQPHPLYPAARQGVLKAMFFNGGPLGIESNVADTEYFGKYEGGNMKEIKGQWFCIAYRPKDNGLSGRAVMATGHPEVDYADYVLAMARYAVAHDYEVPRKYIKPGTAIKGVCGDDQMQYYAVKTGEGGQKATVTLSGLDENCDLYLRYKLPPTFTQYDVKSVNDQKADENLTLAKTKPGEYFVGVHGKHRVLNGANYELKVMLE